MARQSLRQREHHLALATKRYDAGVGRRIDVLQAEAEKASAELSQVEARNQERLARGRLASAMGLEVSRPLEIQDIPESAFTTERNDAEALLDTAAKHRPQLQEAVAEIARRRLILRAEEAARRPELSATANYGWNDTHLLPEERHEWHLALEFSMPLFTGFQRTYTIREAQAQLRQAVNRYERLLRDVELEVWEAYSSLLQAEEAIKVAAVFVRTSQEGVEVAEQQYKQGRATIVELIDAQTAYSRAQARQVTARMDWYSALARMERAVGRAISTNSKPAAASEEQGAEELKAQASGNDAATGQMEGR